MTNKRPLIDDLDKRILQQMSKGINSYEDLSRECNVTRSTVYRRVSALEKAGCIRRITRAVVDYEKLDIVTLCIASTVTQANLKKALATLKINPRVKLLWRTYGDHNLLFVVLCEKGEEGERIHELKNILEKYGAIEVSVSIGFTWEKMDFTPFVDETQNDKQLKLYYSGEEQLTSRNVELKFKTSRKE